MHGGRARLPAPPKPKLRSFSCRARATTTDPLGQAEEMYRALRQEGVPVELVTYPREDHGPLAVGIFGRPVAGTMARLRRPPADHRVYRQSLWRGFTKP